MNIALVSEKFDVSQDTLRYYEKIGLLPRIHRLKSGIRDYSDEDCSWVEFIKYMREAGVNIKALQRYVALYQKGDSTIEERKAILIKQRETLHIKIREMQNILSRLDNKINNYENFSKLNNML